MGEIVNLRMARKRRKREDEAKQAAENRDRHGRTRQERDATTASRDAADRLLDGHRLPPPTDTD